MCKAIEEMRNEALKEGIEQGIEQGVKTIALRMLKAGKYALEEVAAISGLSLDEVKELSEEQTA